ncbi:putative ribonuclease H-like domain-containing protein, partial [Tanacetum coccineum]
NEFAGLARVALQLVYYYCKRNTCVDISFKGFARSFPKVVYGYYTPIPLGNRVNLLKGFGLTTVKNDVKVKQIRTDIGTMFRNFELESFGDEKGISQNFSSPYTPEQNGVATRKNRTHFFTLPNLRIPLPKFFYEVVNYFKVHISRFSPFGLAKLTMFVVICKAYGGEPSVDLLQDFLNLGTASNWLTLSNRSDPNVPKAVTKPITLNSFWKTTILAKSLSKMEVLVMRREAPPSTMSVNKDTLIIDAHPLTSVLPSQFAENTADLDDAPSEKDDVILVDRIVANKAKNWNVGTSLKVPGKRK